MAHVNLLPWREKLRQQQKQNYVVVLMTTGLIVAMLFWMIGQIIDQQIGNQNARNQFLQTEIQRLESLITEIQKVRESKRAIEKRMALIEQLEASRNIAPMLLDELVRVLPPGITFTNMRRLNDLLEIEGVTDSNNRLSEFMRGLDNSSYFSEPDLTSIVADTSDNTAVNTFKLKVKHNDKLDAGMNSEEDTAS